MLRTRYAATPVHSVAEITMLAERFPENIKLFAVYKQQEMLAGSVVYESAVVAHTQYIAVSETGKKISALDLLVDTLFNHYCSDKKYLDFGISTEDGGRRLNAGLIENKQSFGGRAVVHDFYEFDVGNNLGAL
jgi:hypothetical protein